MSLRGREQRVVTALSSYVAAVAELPLSAALADDVDDVDGAVVVVPGSGDWWNGMMAAREGGAAAVVIADPRVFPTEALTPDAWPGGIPVVVERPRLRPDVVADAVRARRGSPARIVTVECAAPAVVIEAAICDGLGWARSLVHGPLTLRTSAATAHGGIALLDSGGSAGGQISITLATTTAATVGPRVGRGAGCLLQVLALGEVRTELKVDQPASLMRLETSDRDGALRAPERYESSARLALRRALEACASGEHAADLDELLEDMALTRGLFRE